MEIAEELLMPLLRNNKVSETSRGRCRGCFTVFLHTYTVLGYVFFFLNLQTKRSLRHGFRVLLRMELLLVTYSK